MHFWRREHAHLPCLLIEPFQFLFMHADNQFIAIITQSKYEISFKRLCAYATNLSCPAITVDSRSVRTDQIVPSLSTQMDCGKSLLLSLPGQGM